MRQTIHALIILLTLAGLVLSALPVLAQDDAVETPTPVVTLESTLEPTLPLTPTQELEPTATVTEPPSPTLEPTATPTLTPTPMLTPTETIDPTDEATLEPTPTLTATPTETVEPPLAPTLTPTLIVTPTVAIEPTNEPTLEPTPSITPTVILTVTTTPTPTNPPFSTATPAPVEPTPQPTETPPPTPTPTATSQPPPPESPTPTPTPSPLPTCADTLEPNDQPEQAAILLLNQPLTELTLASLADRDYFQLWVKPGRSYELSTATSQGVDTRLRLLDAAGNVLSENDDVLTGTGDPASRISFLANTEGWLWAMVDTAVPLEWGCRTYSLLWREVAPPTPTPTSTPRPTQPPEPTAVPPPTSTPLPTLFDAYEPNWDFERAADIAVGQVLDLNFYPWPADHPGPDNDFFRFSVKAGQALSFETLDLAPGLDTNLILYREDRTVIAGNDDCNSSERRSCLTWTPDYTGLAYALIGPVGLVPKGIAPETLSYRFSLTDQALQPEVEYVAHEYGQSAPIEDLPWEVVPPEPTDEPLDIQVQTFSLSAPAPTPEPLEPILIELTVYYDENDNKAPDFDEGVAGLGIRVLDSVTNRLLAQGFTDEQGYARIAVSAAEPVRVTVAYLGYSQPVRSPGDRFEIRLPGQELPGLIP